MFVSNKLIAVNKDVDKVINLFETVDKIFIYVTKITRATAGAAGAAKDSADVTEFIIC